MILAAETAGPQIVFFYNLRGAIKHLAPTHGFDDILDFVISTQSNEFSLISYFLNMSNVILRISMYSQH